MSFLLRQIKFFFTNRLGLALVFFNLFLAIWGIFEKGENYDIFHFYYEPIPIKIITIINLPALFAAGILTELVLSPPKSGWSFVTIGNFEMLHIVIFSIFQWLSIGYVCNLIYRSYQDENQSRN